MLFFLLVVLGISEVYSQEISNQEQTEELEKSKKKLRKDRPKFIGFTFGLNTITLRDFATSPLFYSGITNYFGISSYKSDQTRERDFSFNTSTGILKNNYNNISSFSQILRFDVQYSQLYQLKNWNRYDINTKIGFLYNIFY